MDMNEQPIKDKEITLEEALDLELFKIQFKESSGAALTKKEQHLRIRIIVALDALKRERDYKEVFSG